MKFIYIYIYIYIYIIIYIYSKIFIKKQTNESDVSIIFSFELLVKK